MFNSIKSWLLVISIAFNILLAFGLKYYYTQADNERVHRTALEEVYHNLAIEASKIQEKTKVITRYIERPDGTKVHEKVEESDKREESTKVSDETAEKRTETVVVPESKSHYSATVLGPVQDVKDHTKYGFYFGFRIWDLPLEAQIGGRPFERELQGGLRYEW